jgi:hypothetical protein
MNAMPVPKNNSKIRVNIIYIPVHIETGMERASRCAFVLIAWKLPFLKRHVGIYLLVVTFFLTT